jgi:hypothetical protein
MYANAPPEVDAAKAMLLATATYATVTGASVHYPSVSNGDSVSPDALPYFLIEPAKKSPKILAPGVLVPGGTIQIIFAMKDSSGSDIEKLAHAIAEEIQLVPTGLPLLNAEVGLCSMPEPSSRAAQSYDDQQVNNQTAAIRQIPIILTYGLS